jgi:hypothetical protein
MAVGSRRSAAAAAPGASRLRSERRSYRRTEYTRDAAAARSQAECRDAVSTASRPLPAPMATSIERTLPLPAGPRTGPSSPVPATSERPQPRVPDHSANAKAACKSRRSREEPGTLRHPDWQNGRAEEARGDRSPSILPPHNRDRDECRAPLPRHQTVLEWFAPLWLNVRTEIFVPPSNSYSRSSYCRTSTMAFGRARHRRISDRTGRSDSSRRRRSNAAPQRKPKTRAKEPESTMSVCNCAREH